MTLQEYRQWRAGLHMFLHEPSDRGESNDRDVGVLLTDMDWVPPVICKSIIKFFLSF